MRPTWLTYHPEDLETGDIVFRRGNSMASHVILSTDKHASFSHVGLIKKINDQIFVIHATPGELLDGDTVVRVESLETFLAIDLASAAAVYRVRQDQHNYALRATEVALSYAAARIPFDLGFDLKTPDSLYCTELVWRAYLEAGLDLVDGEFDQLSIPFSKGSYILPSRLLMSRWLQPIYVSIPTIDRIEDTPTVLQKIKHRNRI